jgi:replicative DNA helicase
MPEEMGAYSEEAERGLLGSLMVESATTADVIRTRKLRVEAFYVPAHRTIFEAAWEVVEQRGVCDLVLTVERLQAMEKLESAGGEVFVGRLVDSTPTAAHAEYYADIVREKWMLRQIERAALEIRQATHEDKPAETVLADGVSRLTEINTGVVEVKTNRELMEASAARWEAAEKGGKPAIGLTTPWPILTETMCGLEPGVTIVAGRPSAGKTTLMDILMHHSSQAKLPALIVSMDQTQRELLERTLAREACVSLPKLKLGYARKDQLAAVREAIARIDKRPVYILDGLHELREIMGAIRMAKRRWGIAVVAVDYLQLMTAGELGRAGMTDAVLRTTHVSSQMKALALALDIPLVLLSQLSREVEKEGRDPRLSDLRDSGAIEQDAHKVIFAYRDMKKWKEMEKAEAGATKHKRPVWLNLMKHKDGQTGAMAFWMYPPYFRLEPAEGDFEDDGLPEDAGQLEAEFRDMPELTPGQEGEAGPERGDFRA